MDTLSPKTTVDVPYLAVVKPIAAVRVVAVLEEGEVSLTLDAHKIKETPPHLTSAERFL